MLVGPLLAAPAQAAVPDPAYDANLLNILPPGSQGTYTTDQAALAMAGQRPPNTVDQLATYDNLTKTEPAAIDEARLASLYKRGALGVAPADVVSTSTPRPGVTIQRDRDGVPHVTGTTYEDTLFGAGYAGTEDRMFLQDTLRHVGAARAAEFLGPSATNIAMDQAQLKVAAYTKEEAGQQIKNLAVRYGAEGAKYVSGVDAFVAGINAAQRALCPANSPVAPSCPAEYAALQIVPTDYTPADVTYTASLVGGIFGKGGGGEGLSARWLQQLQQKFGAAEGRRVFDDLRESKDPEAPVTSPVPAPYGSDGPYDAADSLLPNLNAAVVPATGTRTDAGAGLPTGAAPIGAGQAGGLASGSALLSPAAPDHLDGPLGPIDLSRRPASMSNALLVDAQHSATGHPLAVFGPQTGYFAPQLLTEVDLKGPGIAARGVSFAGTQAVVQLGHGVDYAWSATSASNDNVDLVAERLCNTSGTGAVTTGSDGYLVDDACQRIDSYTHTETAKPSAGGTGAPAVLTFSVQRTRHGVVQYRTTAGGVPVALTVERSTYGAEFDSVVGFARMNDPGYVHSAADFKRAFSAVDYSFNWFYADDKDIAYYNSARLPVRPAALDPALPRDGSRTALDWQGFVSPDAMPQVVDPPNGMIVSWNNKQAPGIAANDIQWGYGPVYRSLALSRQVQALFDRGPVTRAQLVGAMAGGAVEDLRGKELLPLVLEAIGTPPADLAPAVAQLRAWLAAGAQRVDRDRDGAYSFPAAVALMDTWWQSQTTSPKGAISLPKDLMRGGLGDLVDALPQPVDDHPRQGLGSSWNNVAWYGYVSKDLRRLLGKPETAPYSRAYCGGGDLVQCRADLVASLRRAVTEVSRAQGTSDVSKWTYDKHQDDIRSTSVGVVGVPNIDWQNRPTFQQVVAFTDHRPRETGPTPVVPEAPVALLLPLAAALGIGVRLRRRRRA